MEINEIEKTINSIMTSIKEHRSKTDYYGLVTDGIACIEYSYKLINIITYNEQEYRKIEVREIENGSLGRADAIAKASDYYKDWKKALLMHDCLLEMNMTCKKLAFSNEKEIKSI